MVITPVLWFIIPIQLLLLLIVIWLCVKILKQKIRIDNLTKNISFQEDNWKRDDLSIIGKIITVVKSHEAKGKTINYEDISDLVYNELTQNDSLIKALINSEVILGLAGTFFGLILSLSNFSPDTMSANLTAEEFISALIKQMSPFLNGLSAAFGASFLGVIFMLAGNLLYSFANRKREKNISNLLFVVSSELLPSLASAKPEEKIYQSVDHFSGKVEVLTEKIRESLFDFNSRFEVLIKKTTDSFNITLDKILDENKFALNSQIINLQSSTTHLMEIKNQMIDTAGIVTKASENQFAEISKLHKRIDEGNAQLFNRIQEYINSQAKLVGLFEDSKTNHSEMLKTYSEHFDKLDKVGEQTRNMIVQTSESISGILLKTNKLIEEHFNSISQEYDKRLLEAVTQFNNKSSEVFGKFDNNSAQLNNLINQTGQNADRLENVLLTSLAKVNEGIKISLDSLSKNFKENLSQLETMNKLFPEFLLGMGENNLQIKDIIGSFDSIVVRFESNVQSNVAKYFETIEDITKELKRNFERIEKENSKIISNIDSFTRAQSFSSDLIKQFEETVKLTLDPITKFKDAAEDVRRTFDSFENDFLKKQEELFTKICDQKDISVNMLQSGDGHRQIKQEKQGIDPNINLQPIQPPSGYFVKKRMEMKEKRKKKEPMEINNPIEIEVKAQNWFRKKAYSFFGIDQKRSNKNNVDLISAIEKNIDGEIENKENVKDEEEYLE